jgi:hypothetical protein
MEAHLPVRTFWDGTPCSDRLLFGDVRLVRLDAGIEMTARLPHQPHPSIPDAPLGTRVANLWEYDVVECFLVGSDGYLEIELGAGGHFLALDFSLPRVRRNEYTDWKPKVIYTKDAGDGAWESRILIPNHMVPNGLSAANAFVICGNSFLCYHPLHGPQPDFHQLDRFPPLTFFSYDA